ncbi:formin-like protein 6 [Fukomys damarensis]|uniref:formin-like protein 6 n=1 Tax=Fukomys damarensis TaxID=885580 RepID=UPI00053FF645|nr:formin-like protein 6 [Fukomys damarensis]
MPRCCEYASSMRVKLSLVHPSSFGCVLSRACCSCCRPALGFHSSLRVRNRKIPSLPTARQRPPGALPYHTAPSRPAAPPVPPAGISQWMLPAALLPCSGGAAPPPPAQETARTADPALLPGAWPGALNAGQAPADSNRLEREPDLPINLAAAPQPADETTGSPHL